MQQQNENVGNKPFTAKLVRLSDLVGGQIVDKRRLGLHPDRIVDALKADYLDLAGWIKESGEYMVVISAMPLTDAQQSETAYYATNGQPLSYAQPIGGYMGHMSVNIGFFSGTAAEGLVVSLNPAMFQGIQQLGESGMVNVVLDVISGGQVNREIGFSNTYRGRK